MHLHVSSGATSPSLLVTVAEKGNVSPSNTLLDVGLTVTVMGGGGGGIGDASTAAASGEKDTESEDEKRGCCASR